MGILDLYYNRHQNKNTFTAKYQKNLKTETEYPEQFLQIYKITCKLSRCFIT